MQNIILKASLLDELLNFKRIRTLFYSDLLNLQIVKKISILKFFNPYSIAPML